MNPVDEMVTRLEEPWDQRQSRRVQTEIEAAMLIRSLVAEIAVLRSALEPFSIILDEYDPDDEDDETPATLVVGSVTDYSLTLGDLRRARVALKEQP